MRISKSMARPWELDSASKFWGRAPTKVQGKRSLTSVGTVSSFGPYFTAAVSITASLWVPFMYLNHLVAGKLPKQPKHEAVFQEPPCIPWPPFSPTRRGREINKEQAVRGKACGSGEREWEAWKIEENNLCGKLLFSLRICKCSSSRETRDEQHFYNRISPGFTRGKGEFTCNAWHLLQHQALEQYCKVLFIAAKRRDKKLLPTNWIFIYLLSKLLQKTVYDIFILLILCQLRLSWPKNTLSILKSLPLNI